MAILGVSSGLLCYIRAEKLNGEYPSFKNYVWAAQHILNGGDINNNTDQLIFDIINKKI